MTHTIEYRSHQAQVPSGAYGYARGYADVRAVLRDGDDEIEIRAVWTSGAGAWSGTTERSFRGAALRDAERIAATLAAGETPPDFGYHAITPADVEDARDRLARRRSARATEDARAARREGMRAEADRIAGDIPADLCEAGVEVVATASTVYLWSGRYGVESPRWSPSGRRAAGRQAAAISDLREQIHAKQGRCPSAPPSSA